MDAFTPIKGKCTWWREVNSAEDEHNIMVKEADRRVTCTCFVEGYYWPHTRGDVPSDCPHARSCRYYIRHL